MIEIEGLGFGYGRDALYRDFALNLSEPGLYGLFGRNGSGKSTLLMLIAGMRFRKSGEIRVIGRDPQRRSPAFLADTYLVPEEFHLPNLSCERLAHLQARFYPRFSQAVFEEAMTTFEIERRTTFDRMSLGGRKKAVIAFALATLTPVLLLDEPTNGMDIVGRDQFRHLLRRPEHAERLVLISTHQAHDLEQLISRVLFIDRGQLALGASMEALARALRMGIVDGDGVGTVEGVVYQERLGAQTAYIATGGEGAAPAPVQLELLYRALCRAPEPLLRAIGSEGARHV